MRAVGSDSSIAVNYCKLNHPVRSIAFPFGWLVPSASDHETRDVAYRFKYVGVFLWRSQSYCCVANHGHQRPQRWGHGRAWRGRALQFSCTSESCRSCCAVKVLRAEPSHCQMYL